jgi:hypothetical protein
MRDAAIHSAEPTSDAAEFGAGTEYFQLESFGISSLEVSDWGGYGWLAAIGTAVWACVL